MASTLTNLALEEAISQVGVRETERNRGPEVDAYLLSIGLDPTLGSYPWCAAFCFWCYSRAANALQIANPMIKTGRAHRLWSKTPFWYRTMVPVRGALFLIDHGGGRGHMGFVEFVPARGGGQLVTVEGNTGPDGGRDGDGVYRRSTRRREDMMGFIDYSLPMPEEVA